jgi:hypothetical protein
MWLGVARGPLVQRVTRWRSLGPDSKYIVSAISPDHDKMFALSRVVKGRYTYEEGIVCVDIERPRPAG